jgi:NADPH-dependent F420 reductase
MIAFLGGTGPEGRGLALRLAIAGEEVIIGSRDQSRARATAEAIGSLSPNLRVSGEENAVAVQQAGLVFLTFPYEGQKSTLQQLGPHLVGKIVVNVIAPLSFSKGWASAVDVEEGSASAQSQQMLPDSRVVAAFQNISAEDLVDPHKIMDGDVIVCSDHPDEKKHVMEMVTHIPHLRSLDGGGLENARYVELFTAMLVNINRIYKCHSTIKIIGP